MRARLRLIARGERVENEMGVCERATMSTVGLEMIYLMCIIGFTEIV